MHINKLDNNEIDVARMNIAKKAKGFKENDVELDNVSPMLYEIK